MRRIFAAIVLLALAGVSVWHYRDDAAARAPLLEAARTFTLDVRRPVEVEMIKLAPSADFASQLLAMSAINDALGTTRLRDLPPSERRAWLDVPVHLDDQIAAASDQQLVAIRRNPGWPLHRYYLGKLAYTRDRRSVGADIRPDEWIVPLQLARADAPGHEQLVETLAAVLLEAWNVVPDAARETAPAVLEQAFADPKFVRLAFDVAVETAGRDVAVRALPDDPLPLIEAARALGRSGDVESAASLYERWESAEWALREADLDAMRTRLERGDWKGLVAAMLVWSSRHSVGEFDTPAALRQEEEVLRLWPKDRVGSWSNDPRARSVRFFLDRRLGAIDPAVLEATVATLGRTPAPVRARIALAAGNRSRAESFVKNSGSEGAFEWTDYYVDLARWHVRRSDATAAAKALARVSPAARQECDVVVVSRLAGMPVEPLPAAISDEAGNVIPEAWSKNGMLGVCVDPLSMGTATLQVDLHSETPTFVEWGLNSGRRDAVLVDGTRRISVPLRGLEGRNVFYSEVLWGAAAVERRASVVFH